MPLQSIDYTGFKKRSSSQNLDNKDKDTPRVIDIMDETLKA